MALDLTTLRLTVLDALDGETATVSVSGAGAGGAVSLFRAPWNPEGGGRLEWAEVGGGTADGSGSYAEAVSTTPGFYVWTAARMATATAADRLACGVYRPIIDPAEAVHYRILDAVVTTIRSLNLDGIGSGTDRVIMRWMPVFLFGVDELESDPPGVGLPMIQAAPYGREIPMDVMTHKDDVGYPIMVGFFDEMKPTLDEGIPRALKWRRQVAAAFRAQQLNAVGEVVLCAWQPDIIADAAGMHQNYMVGAMTFLFRSREARGLIP